MSEQAQTEAPEISPEALKEYIPEEEVKDGTN